MVEPFSILPDVHKIAVLRANAIGDLVFALPAFDALRAAYPRAEIVLLGQPWHARFMTGRRGPIDRVIVVPRVPGVRDEVFINKPRAGIPARRMPPANGSPPMDASENRETRGAGDPPETVERFFQEMREEHFDLAIQLHGGGRNSNPFVLRLGARLTAGLQTPDAPPLDLSLPFYYYQPEIMRCLEVVSLVGARPLTIEPRLELRPGEVEESMQVVPPSDRPLVALHPGAGDGRRRWPPEKFAAVGDTLAGAGAQIVVTGSGFEEELVEGVVSAMHAPARSLCGALSLGGLVGLLSRCALVVSNDSGPLHLASNCGLRGCAEPLRGAF